MPEISKVQLPSGGVYDIKDATARQMISGGVSFIVAWDGASTPVPGNIPYGVVVTYQGTDYTGTLAADSATAGAFYLVRSSTAIGTSDVYDEYVPVGPSGSRSWEKIGDTQVDLSNVVTNVSLSKSTDVVLGEATTFTNSTSAVTFSGGTTDVALGEGTTFALTSGSVTFGTPTTDTFVKSVTAETNKNLVTTTVPNVTSAGSASTWTFTMGTGDASETLIIGGGNSTAPTLGTAITVATGATSTSGTGDAVVTGVTVGSSASAVTALPTASVGTGITVGTNDKITAVTGVGTGTAAAQTITVGTNDQVTALTNSTTLNVTYGGSPANNVGNNTF